MQKTVEFCDVCKRLINPIKDRHFALVVGADEDWDPSHFSVKIYVDGRLIIYKVRFDFCSKECFDQYMSKLFQGLLYEDQKGMNNG